MSSAAASRPLNSLLLSILMITSSMAVALTAMPWMADTVIADGTYDGSDASDNYSFPSQATTFDVVLNGTLNSSDQQDWYYIEMYSGDTLDLEASCVTANCGTVLGISSSNIYNLTTNMSDTSFTYTNNGSTSYNITFGFYNYALQSTSTYLFEAKMTNNNGTGGGNQTTEQVDVGVWNGTQVTGPVSSNLSAGNYSLAWEVFNISTTGTYLLTSSIYIGNNSYYSNHSLNTSSSYNTVPFTLSVIDSDCSIYMNGDLWDVGGNNSQWLTSYNYYGYGPCVNTGGNGTGGNGTGGQNDMNTSGDVGWAQLTNFNSTLTGTVGGNDSSDSYYILLYPGDELEFDANCDGSQCSVTMQANSSALSTVNSWYNLTTNYTDSVYFYNNTNSYDEYVYITFYGSSAIEEDYQFYAAVSNNNQNGTGGNGNQSSTEPSLTLNITEEYDWGNGNGANYTFELQIDDLDANHTYSFGLYVSNATGDDWLSMGFQGSTGNSSTTITSPSLAQSNLGMHLDSGCYLIVGFAIDETIGYGEVFVVDFVALHSTCTSVFPDMKDDAVNSGDDLEAIFHLVDVNPGTTYTIEWQVRNDTTLIDNGNFTSYNSTSDIYDFKSNISTAGWADDCYTLWAELEVNGTVITNAFGNTDSQFELGSGTCEDASIWVGTDNSWYSNTSVVEVFIEAYDLDDTMNYTVEWAVYDSTNYAYNWSNYSISNTDWSENTLSFWNMNDECYSIEVELYDEHGNSHDSDEISFDVGQGCNTQAPTAWVELWNDGDHWDLGDSIELYYDLNDLTLNNSYYMEWNIQDNMDWNQVDNGSMELNFTTVEDYSSMINASGLSEGCYWMAITLYDASMNGAYMDSDNQEFGVGDIDCNPLYVNMQTYDITSGYEANFSMEMGNMMNGSNYSLTFKLFNDTNLLNETTFDFMGYDETVYDNINFGYLQDGCYMVQIYFMEENGDAFTNVGEWFKVGDVFCGSVHLEMLDHHTVYMMTNETVMFGMKIHDGEIDQTIEFDYDLYEIEGMYTMAGSFNITINSEHQSMPLGLGNLSDGCYSLAVSWYDSNDDYRSESADFAVGSNDGCWDARIWIHGSEGEHFENGDNVSFTVVVEDRMPNESYSVSWNIMNSQGVYVENDWFDPLNEGPRHLENISVSGLNNSDCFTIDAVLFDEAGYYIDDSQWMFDTGDGDCWPPQIETWHNERDDDSFELKAFNLESGTDYYLGADIYDDDDNLVFSVNESVFAWNDAVHFNYNISSLGDGCYYAESWLDDDDEIPVDRSEGEVFSIGEVNCWLDPYMDVDWNGDGALQFGISDLKESDEYGLNVEVYSYDEISGEAGAWDSSASDSFTAVDGWQYIYISFDLEDGESYWVEVQLTDSDGDIVLEDSYGIWVYQNSEEISINIENDTISTGGDLEFNVSVQYLDVLRTGYELSVSVFDRDYNKVDFWNQDILSSGEYSFQTEGQLDNGYYNIEAQLFETLNPENAISYDDRRICVGDECPSWEVKHGNASMDLRVNWDDRPTSGGLYCSEITVNLVPEQRLIDDQNGDATYGAYPDWWANEHFSRGFIDLLSFSYDGIPSGDYAVIIEMRCSDISEGYELHHYENIDIYTFTDQSTTQVEIDLETRIDDGNGGDDDIGDKMDEYSTGEYTYRAFLRDGSNGPELVISLDMVLDSTAFIQFVDSEEGDGDGQISAEENDMIQYMLSIEEKDNDFEVLTWNGIEFTAADLILSGYDMSGLVDGENVIFRDFYVFSVNLEAGGELTFWDDEYSAEDLCDDGDYRVEPSLSFVAVATPPYEVISVEGTNSDFTENANGALVMQVVCGDLMPGELTINFGEEEEEVIDDGEGNNTTNVTNTPPSCFIHWYRDGDDLTNEGMALLTAGDTIDEITVTEGDSFTIYVYCWDDDGDEITLSIEPPFGSDATFTGNSSVMEFIQLTVPTGFTGTFEFGAGWSDAATGGEFDFDIIIEAADDGGDDEKKESDSTSSASFVPGFTGVFTIAAFLGAVLVMMRREQEE